MRSGDYMEGPENEGGGGYWLQTLVMLDKGDSFLGHFFSPP
jgi:hypothetical protein